MMSNSSRREFLGARSRRRDFTARRSDARSGGLDYERHDGISLSSASRSCDGYRAAGVCLLFREKSARPAGNAPVARFVRRATLSLGRARVETRGVGGLRHTAPRFHAGFTRRPPRKTRVAGAGGFRGSAGRGRNRPAPAKTARAEKVGCVRSGGTGETRKIGLSQFGRRRVFFCCLLSSSCCGVYCGIPRFACVARCLFYKN